MSEEQEQPQEYHLPEMSVQELAEWLRTARNDFFVLDVREPYEFPRAKLQDERVAYAPLSDLARKHIEGLPPRVREERERTLVVMCHHGLRSGQVAAWLLDLGYPSVYNLAGGIDAYARQVDPTVGQY